MPLGPALIVVFGAGGDRLLLQLRLRHTSLLHAPFCVGGFLGQSGKLGVQLGEAGLQFGFLVARLFQPFTDLGEFLAGVGNFLAGVRHGLLQLGQYLFVLSALGLERGLFLAHAIELAFQLRQFGLNLFQALARGFLFALVFLQLGGDALQPLLMIGLLLFKLDRQLVAFGLCLGGGGAQLGDAALHLLGRAGHLDVLGEFVLGLRSRGPEI